MQSNDIRDAIQALFQKELESNEKAEKFAKEIAELEQSGISKDDKKYKDMQVYLNSLTFDGRLDMFAHQAESISLGTHISKGISPLSKGDCVVFKRGMNKTPSTLVGTHNIKAPLIDITGASQYFVADASIYSFLNLVLPDGSQLVDLLIMKDDRLKDALSDDKKRAESLFSKLLGMFDDVKARPKVDAFNKQVYFPLNADTNPLAGLDGFESATIIPLFPSSLNIHIAHMLKEERQKRRDAWELRKEGEVGGSYLKTYDMAFIGLGGTRPANTSKLAQKAAGSNYLFSNLPPQSSQKRDLFISKQSSSVFNTRLFNNSTRKPVSRLTHALSSYDSKSATKTKIDSSLIEAISAIYDVALKLQSRPKGWLAEHDLDINEKFWLDPNRGKVLGQERYDKKRSLSEWQGSIFEGISHYLIEQVELKAKYEKRKLLIDLDAYIFDEWVVVARKVAEKYKLLNKEVF